MIIVLLTLLRLTIPMHEGWIASIGAAHELAMIHFDVVRKITVCSMLHPGCEPAALANSSFADILVKLNNGVCWLSHHRKSRVLHPQASSFGKLHVLLTRE